jgi:uncharacterized protein
MTIRKLTVLATLLLSALPFVHGADLAGKWTSEFESQIGLQKYIYEFQVEGAKITGKATHDHSMGKGEAPLKDIKLNGEDLSFVELLSLEGNEITITYTGQIVGDEIKLTRVVGDFATEQIIVKRAKPAGNPVEPKPAPGK